MSNEQLNTLAIERDALLAAERNICDSVRQLANSQQYVAFAAAREQRAAIRQRLTVVRLEMGFWRNVEAA